MKTLLILGAGSAGTMFANRIVRRLDSSEWKVIVVDKDEWHCFQPDLLFVPFGMVNVSEALKPRRKYLHRDVEFILSDVELIEPEESRVRLTQDGRLVHYDYLVIATGSRIVPSETAGLLEDGWQVSKFDFYTPEGAAALGQAMASWNGGRLVVHVAEMPIKCPVAPLEFAFLADWYFHRRGIRDRVELIYATPLPGAFTKPRATAVLGDFLERKHIRLEPDFNIMEVDNPGKVLRSYDGRELPYDLLVTIPTNMGAEVIGRSGMGDELNFVPTDKHTLQSKKWPNVWVVGDAANIPTSKAGSVAHFMLEAAMDNLLLHTRGLPLESQFDGHANCFIETGFGKAILIDFNYDVEPLPGTYPVPGLGPLTLLKETHLNHWGKLGFRWLYWNVLLRGADIPLPASMTMTGKRP